MKSIFNQHKATEEVSEDFNWVKTIIMMVLVLCFIGASFYVLIASYLDLS